MGIVIELDPAFGYIVLNIALFWFVNMWMIINLRRARVKYDVKVGTHFLCRPMLGVKALAGEALEVNLGECTFLLPPQK